MAKLAWPVATQMAREVHTPSLESICSPGVLQAAPPQPDNLQAYTPPVSLAPPTGCPSTFLTLLHPIPHVLFVLWSWSLPSLTPVLTAHNCQASDSMHLGLQMGCARTSLAVSLYTQRIYSPTSSMLPPPPSTPQRHQNSVTLLPFCLSFGSLS